jgi:hypothetical protein
MALVILRISGNSEYHDRDFVGGKHAMLHTCNDATNGVKIRSGELRAGTDARWDSIAIGNMHALLFTLHSGAA